MNLSVPLAKILGKMPCTEGLATIKLYSDGKTLDVRNMPNSVLTHKLWLLQFVTEADILADIEEYCGYQKGELIRLSTTIPLVSLTEASFANYRKLIERLTYWEQL